PWSHPPSAPPWSHPPWRRLPLEGPSPLSGWGASGPAPEWGAVAAVGGIPAHWQPHRQVRGPARPASRRSFSSLSSPAEAEGPERGPLQLPPTQEPAQKL